MMQASVDAIDTFGPVFEHEKVDEPLVNGSGKNGWGSIAQISHSDRK